MRSLGPGGVCSPAPEVEIDGGVSRSGSTHVRNITIDSVKKKWIVSEDMETGQRSPGEDGPRDCHPGL